MDKNEQEQLLLLEKYASDKTTQFTLQDASAVTGLPVLETEYAIKNLMKKYDCKLQVTDQGDLIYDFGQHLKRRYAKPFTEYIKEFMRWFWKVFTLFYKFMIAATLIIYFLIFIIILIALLVAALSGGGDNNSSSKNSGIGDLIGGIFRIFFSIFEWNTIYDNRTYERYDNYGYNYKHYEEKKSVLREIRKKKGKKVNEEKKGFVASIYDFVFGPPRVEIDNFANQKEVAAFLGLNKGVICIPEVQALAGWTRAEAENFMTECLANFDGKAEISPNGSLYGDFREFIRNKNKTGQAQVIYFWDEYEPEYEITGNTGSRNFAIIAMNLFNLAFANVMLFSSIIPEFALEVDDPGIMPVAYALLGIVPLVYSALFFIIPIIRSFFLRPYKHQQHVQNIRKRLMKAIFQEHTGEISLQKLTEIANNHRKKEEVLSAKIVEEVMKECIYDLGAESYVNDKAEIIYKFESLDRELDDIEAIREENRLDNNIGKVIFEA